MKTFADLHLATLLMMTAGCARKDWIDRTLITVDVTWTWTGSFAAPGGGGSAGLPIPSSSSRIGSGG
jgi:hypothetical protein